MAPAPDLDWYACRLYLSPHVKDSKHTIDTEWSLDDAWEMHEALDVLEDMSNLGAQFDELNRPKG